MTCALLKLIADIFASTNIINLSPEIQQLIFLRKKEREKHGVIFGGFDAFVVQKAILNCCDRAANITRGRILF